jgi:predicted amidophosphoribosyltransferase
VDRVEALIAERARTLGSAEAGAGSPVCPRCGPRPEPDARFCSNCGGGLASPPACRVCHAPLEPGSRFCSNCGVQVPAA